MRHPFFTQVLSLAFFVLFGAGSLAVVVRAAPDFSFPGVGNRTRSLRSLRGQAVVLVIADSQRDRAFRKQVRYLREIYQQFASKQVVFIAALKDSPTAIDSDIPFAVANNGPGVAAAYGVERDFQLVIIGRDGNIDYQTAHVATGERVRDVIQNSFAVQLESRKR
jgi:peroxiredoxin